MSDDHLDDALMAFRERTHGRSDSADHTLDRVLAHARPRRRTTPVLRWLPAAAVLLVGSAWAYVGEHGPFALPADDAPTLSPAPTVARRTAPTAPAPQAEAPRIEVPPAASPPPSARASVTRAASTTPPTPLLDPAPAPAPAPDPVPAAPAPDLLAADTRDFARADAVHRSGAADSAVRAWDTYLAAHPTGRFVPEARYARAIDLLRAGRRADAAAALAPFANAPDGSYRKADAVRLLATLQP